MIHNYYAVLGTHAKATYDELKEARRRAARNAHPDKTGDNGERMVLVNEAYSVLTDPRKLARYRIQLGAAGHTCPKCEGEGVYKKYKGFTQREVGPCDDCKGAGILLREGQGR